MVMYNICTQAEGTSKQRWPALLCIVMLAAFWIILETIAYASFEKGFPTDSLPTEDGEQDADEKSKSKVREPQLQLC